MKRNDIKEKIIDIFKNELYRDITKCDDVWEESIFGKNIALLPAEAYFLLSEIERVFEIEISYDMIVNRKFDKLKDILDYVQKLN